MKNLPHVNLDLRRAVRQSKIRLGSLEARGVPAILFGAAGIVLAASAMRALRAAAPTLPDTIREIRLLVETNRRTQPLNP